MGSWRLSRVVAADRRLKPTTRRGGLGRPFLPRDSSLTRISERPFRRAVVELRRVAVSLLIVLLALCPVATARADDTPTAGAPKGAALTTWAMRWITELMAGRTDRSQYAPAFAPQVTDEAVARIARDLNAYGALAAARRNRADQERGRPDLRHRELRLPARRCDEPPVRLQRRRQDHRRRRRRHGGRLTAAICSGLTQEGRLRLHRNVRSGRKPKFKRTTQTGRFQIDARVFRAAFRCGMSTILPSTPNVPAPGLASNAATILRACSTSA